MTEELMLQYQGLEEKVAERTRQLEISKKAAEAANESKTLFIANISHELKSKLSHSIYPLCNLAQWLTSACVSSAKWYSGHVCCMYG